MMDINAEIVGKISEKFPQIMVSIFSDETQENMIVAINDDLYYSEDYLNLVMDIKMNVLWPRNILNYLFVKEQHEEPVLPVQIATENVVNSYLVFSIKTGDPIHIAPGYDAHYSGDELWLKAA